MNQDPSPGVISLNPTAPGAYISCFNGEIYDKTDAYYLLDHSQLTWVPANFSSIFKISNTVRINGGNWPFLFGRALINGRYSLGKVYAGNGFYGFYTFTSNGEIYLSTDFEVLTCNISKPCRKFLSNFRSIFN